MASKIYMSPEETNFLRFSCLLLKIAPRAVRHLFDMYYPPGHLYQMLIHKKNKLEDLLNKRIFTKKYWMILYPANGKVSSEHFDLTLMITLFRVISGITPRNFSWNNLPTAHDFSHVADIARIWYYRKKVADATSCSMNTNDFSTAWQDLSQAIIRLGGQGFITETSTIVSSALDTSYQDLYRKLKRMIEDKKIKNPVEIICVFVPDHFDELSPLEDQLPGWDDQLPGWGDELSGLKDQLRGWDDELSRLEDQLPRLEDQLPGWDDQLPGWGDAGMPRKLSGYYSDNDINWDDYESTLVDLSDSDQDYGNETAHQTPESQIPTEILNMDEKALEIYRMALKKEKEKVYNIRVMVVGPSGVGKTTLTKRLLNLDFKMEDTKSTNGIDIHIDESFISVPDGKWIFENDKNIKLRNRNIRLGKILLKTEKTARTSPLDEMQTPVREKQTSSNLKNGATQIQDEPLNIPSLETESQKVENSSSNGSASSHLAKKFSDLQEVIKCIQENDQKLKEDFAEISFWDFGGDIVFYSTHQAFLSPRAIYLLVMDITKGWKDKVEDDKCFTDISGFQYEEIGQYIIFWLNSIHTYGTRGDLDSGCPPIIQVATHLDRLQGEDKEYIENFFGRIRTGLRKNKSILKHIAADLPIDNTIQDPMLEDLRIKILDIASKQRYWGEEIPARWIMLEKALTEKKSQGQKILSFADVMDIGQSGVSQIIDQKEIQVFLMFQNSLGNLIYYNEEELQDYIILEPQWLVDAFKCLITAKKFCLNNDDVINEWVEFDEDAILKQNLLDAVWEQDKDNNFYKHGSHLLGLMQKMDIITKLVTDSEDEGNQYYYVPCMLKEKVTDGYLSKILKEANRTSFLCYVFENNFLPPAVFHRVVSAFVSQWPVAYQMKKKLIFSGCVILDLDRCNRLLICMYSNIIQMSVYSFNSSPDPKLCRSVKTFMIETLQRVTSRFQQHLPYMQHIKCSREFSVLSSIEGLLPVDYLLKPDDMTCYNHKDSSHLINDKFKLLKCWFEDEELKHLHQSQETKYDFLIMHGEEQSHKQLAADLKKTISSATERENSAVLQQDFDRLGEQKLSMNTIYRYFEQCTYIVIIVQDEKGMAEYNQNLVFSESLKQFHDRVIPALHGNLSSNSREKFTVVNALELDDSEHRKQMQIRKLLKLKH